jgi:hypothetical protein
MNSWRRLAAGDGASLAWISCVFDVNRAAEDGRHRPIYYEGRFAN